MVSADFASTVLCPGVHLRFLAVLQCTLCFCIPELREPLWECVKHGLLGSMPLADSAVMMDITQAAAFWQREAAFWMLFTGLVVGVLGDVISRFRRASGEELPAAVAVGWCLLSAVGAAMMPRSGFWFSLATGLWMTYLSLSGSTGGVSKGSASGRLESQPLAPSLQGLSTSDAELAMAQCDNSRRRLRKTIACVIVLTAAYAFLVPGLVTKMFSAKAVVGVSTVLDIEKSTVGLIAMLMQQGFWLPAVVIMLYSVVMPFAKLTVLIAYALPPEWRGAHADTFMMSEQGVRTVQQISKWATVDVFTASTICGLFCQPHMYLEIMLHDGFYYFISYCVLSIIGALLIELPEQETRSHEARDSDGVEVCVESKVRTFASAAVALGLIIALACLPILKAEFALINLNARVSIGTLIVSLWGKGFEWAALCMALLVLAVPALDFVFVALDLTGVTLGHSLLRTWVRDFSMLDVYALACVVVVTAVSALHNDLHMTVLPSGWILFSLSVPWVLYQWSAKARHVVSSAQSESE